MNTKVFIQESIFELETAMRKTKNIRMYKRYSVVSKHFQGLSNKTIVKIECLEEHTVRNYINNYKTKGIDGLVMNKSSSCPRKLNTDQEKQEKFKNDFENLKKTP
jgi:transposase